ncbi:hypothetical protein WT60_03850 [Burkholderia sp. MSMB617WGS]|uniref:Uncharacterized protein n=1 Tax=Burkholderia savannae TaxID=1637837 RepID=A0ABR5TAP1_9BURK|nr:hypothetical protein WT60_03850 [Burkholderia sp. MSMB617WGS]KWZ42058.1 hypothetical protein WS72_03630 [Burkholderia savannae]KWZ45129.1 hypothetical protein WS73_12980 [Burkholderia savannae]
MHRKIRMPNATCAYATCAYATCAYQACAYATCMCATCMCDERAGGMLHVCAPRAFGPRQFSLVRDRAICAKRMRAQPPAAAAR